MDETRARELYVRLTALKKHQETLEQHLQELDGKTVDLREMIRAVQDSKDLTSGDELLVPLAHGIFLPAQAAKTEKLILHVGADVAVEKTPDETIAILEKQQQELVQFREQLLAQYEEVSSEAARIEKEALDEVKDV